jgi:hypothetical protein
LSGRLPKVPYYFYAIQIWPGCLSILKAPIIDRTLLHSKISKPYGMGHLSRDGILGHQFTKDSSLLLHAIDIPFNWQTFKKTILISGFKILEKNPRNKKTQVYSRIVFLKRKNEGRKPDKNSSLKRLEFMPKKLD